MIGIIFYKNKLRSKDISGYSLVEMVIYLAILSVVSLIVINTILSFSQSYGNLRALRLLDHSASSALERMTRDIRSATSVDTANSALGVSPGVLTLLTSASATTTKFYVLNNILQVDVNNASSGPLTVSKSSITNLTFTKLSNGTTTAVKIDMTVSATDGTVSKSKNYHSTVVVLKGK